MSSMKESSMKPSSPKVYDEDGVNYVFGYYTKYEGWDFVPHRFQIVNQQRHHVSGQFLTSNWFSRDYIKNDTGHFMVLGLNKSFSYSKLKEIINSAIPSQIIYHKLNEAEKELGICFKDYYMIDHEKINNLIEDNNLKQDSREISFFGYNGLSKLTMCCRIIKDHVLYLTLPDFTMEFNDSINNEYMSKCDK